VTSFAEHQIKRERLTAELAAARSSGAAVGLAKSTSNLFRRRDGAQKRKLDVRRFNQVLDIDRGRMLAQVEGMTTYEDFVHATLAHGCLPTVVPQLKTITVGGAVSGLGIESSSFRYGLVHETVEEIDVLLGDGSVMTCSRTQSPDLFFGFPNSYGTLGYALRVAVKLIPAKRYVRVRHERFGDCAALFARIEDLCASNTEIDYLDGVVFQGAEMYTTLGNFCDEAPRTSDYTYMRIYYRSIQEKREDFLTSNGYIWRWDTDWFWCSKHFYVQNPAVRLAATKWLLNSRTYQRIMRLAQRIGPESDGTESVIQDVDIPIANAGEFLHFLLSQIGITPIWICPFRVCDRSMPYDLYALDPNTTYVNFGFWDTVPTTREDGYFNRMIEAKALELGGKKGLYSSAYYDEETFWNIYNGARYRELKQKYDPEGVFPDLYDKCVRRR
jgi:FAD/FMN-containing dehydrogenase